MQYVRKRVLRKQLTFNWIKHMLNHILIIDLIINNAKNKINT